MAATWSEMQNGHRFLTLRGKVRFGDRPEEAAAMIVITQNYVASGGSYIRAMREWEMTSPLVVTATDPTGRVSMQFEGEGMKLSSTVFLERVQDRTATYQGSGHLEGFDNSAYPLPD